MSDKILTGPALVVPDPEKRIVDPREAKRIEDRNRKYGPGGERIRPPADWMSGSMTRDEAMDALSKSAVAMGNKVYDQLAEESQQFMQEMEAALMQKIANEFERRSWRGRVRALANHLRFSRVGPWLIELGILEPLRIPELVDAVDVLDPNVRAVCPHDRRESMGPGNYRCVDCGADLLFETPEFREFSDFDEKTSLFIQCGGVAILRHRTGDWHLVGRDGHVLRRAAAALHYDTVNIADDITSVVLVDLDSLKAARALVKNDG